MPTAMHAQPNRKQTNASNAYKDPKAQGISNQNTGPMPHQSFTMPRFSSSPTSPIERILHLENSPLNVSSSPVSFIVP